jgi:hypothetical protein
MAPLRDDRDEGEAGARNLLIVVLVLALVGLGVVAFCPPAAR